MIGNILAILAVILPVLSRYIPALKPVEEKIKLRLERNNEKIEHFKKTRSTKNLGNFPHKD